MSFFSSTLSVISASLLVSASSVAIDKNLHFPGASDAPLGWPVPARNRARSGGEYAGPG
ncbi:Uncharacterised protein [Mycobacteroides abscessus subsp. abscessus]|nr:Uncharacterised protein [Mycobacteroides abscessus subsp. abscessus]